MVKRPLSLSCIRTIPGKKLISLKSATNSDVDFILQFASPSADCLATADVIMYG